MLLVLKTSIAFITFFYINIIFASNFSSKAEYATVIDLDTEAVLYSVLEERALLLIKNNNNALKMLIFKVLNLQTSYH